ncbi:PucR family transcriptional regulator ligand-binding domain-containing protein [Streptomyces sp. NPDC048290]|uniref:PucR family transcriptional regulator n=1 Tax=Streptomyces sp. NPDC048290 TaxID=3155811 RepID=UPI0034382D32
MPTTMHTVLDLPHLRLSLFAGAAGLDRAVSWAHASDLDSPWDWMAGGELLMRNGCTLPESGAGQAGLVERCAVAGASGILIGEDPETPALTDDFAAAADRHGLTVLTASYSVSFVAVARAVADANTGEASARFGQIEKIYGALRDSLVDRAGDSPTARLGRDLGCRLLLLDTATAHPVDPEGAAPEPALRQALLTAVSDHNGRIPGVLHVPYTRPVPGGGGTPGTTGEAAAAAEAGQASGAGSTSGPGRASGAGEASGAGRAPGAGKAPGAAGTSGAGRASGAGETPGAGKARGTAGTPGAGRAPATGETPGAGKAPSTAGTPATGRPSATGETPGAGPAPSPAGTPGAGRAPAPAPAPAPGETSGTRPAPAPASPPGIANPRTTTVLAVEVPAEEPTVLVAVELPGLDTSLLHHLATAAAVETARQGMLREHERRLGSELLAQLLDARVDPGAAREELAAHRLPAEDLVVLAVSQENVAEQRDLHLALSRRRVPHLLLNRSDLLLALLTDRPGDVAAVQQRLGPDTPIGLSGTTALERISDARDEAVWSLALARTSSGGLVRYGDETGFTVLRSHAEARAIADRVLGPLTGYDRANGTDLLGTLRSFLVNRRSWQRTAAALNVHKQTVMYRIQRVEELTGRRLAETADITELWIAYQAHALLRGEVLR